MAAPVEQQRVTWEEVQDQTAREDRRSRIEREHERYRDFFEFAPDAFLVTDSAGVIVEANRAASELFEIQRRFLVGKPLVSFVAPHERRRFRRDLAALASTRAVQERQYELMPREGPPRVAEISVVYGFDDGEPALRWVIRDVTERRQVELELRLLADELEARVTSRTAVLEQAKRQLELVVGQIPAGVVIAEAPAGRVVLANERARELLGAEAAVAGDLLKRVLNGEQIEGELIEAEGEGGTGRTLEVRAAPVCGRGRRVVSAVATFVDVTERERRERAEREFISNAAHELRTPLAAITSGLEVLQAGAKDDPEVRDTFLEHLERQCNRLNRLVPALLMLARAQMRQTIVEREVIPLRPLLDELAAELRPPSAVEVAVDCDPKLAVLANRTLTEQALWNVAMNAERYTTTGSIRLAARGDHGWAAIEVRDTGPGIDEEDRDRVFERFYRGESAAPGVGLGLAIVRESVRAMGGSVTIDSAPDGGTTARIRLPATTLEEA